MLQACPRLTKLQLRACGITDGLAGLAALPAVPQLKHLQLTNNKPTAETAAAWDPSADRMSSTVLQHLQALETLDLTDNENSWYLDTRSLQHLSSLTNLQELDVSSHNMAISPSTTPGISRLTALTKLKLHEAVLDLAVLQHSTQLQHLSLGNVTIVEPDDAAAALLTIVGRLQQLRQLWLYTLEYDWPAASAAYSSLTASSSL